MATAQPFHAIPLAQLLDVSDGIGRLGIGLANSDDAEHGFAPGLTGTQIDLSRRFAYQRGDGCFLGQRTGVQDFP